jgi:hypothetical protein
MKAHNNTTNYISAHSIFPKNKLLIIFMLIVVNLQYSCYKEDTTKPIIELNGEDAVYIELYQTYTELGATAYDNEDGDLSKYIAISNNLQITTLGKYNITYTVTDKSGNTAIKNRYVYIIFTSSTDTLKSDTISPVITIIGMNPVYLKTNSPYNDLGATAMDNVYGDLTPFITTYNNFNTSTEGTYYITYTVSDYSGNYAEKSRVIYVINDHTPPSLNLLGPNPLTMPIHKIYFEPGATSYDAYWGNLTAQIQITNNINTDVAGSYTVHYLVKDPLGNATSKQRTVIVSDTIQPPPLTNY